MSNFLFSLLMMVVLCSVSDVAFSQCSTATGPVYSNSCSSEYYKVITATGSAGVSSTINYSGTSCGGTYYSYYDVPLGPQGIIAPLGATINVFIKKATGYNSYVSIYVDWNNDGIYETTELAGTQLFFSTGTSTQTYIFTVPTTGVVAGVNLHMRIMLSELTGGAPCTANYGETCDYFLNVNCAAPIISVSPGSGGICSGGPGISLAASGAGTGGTYAWSPSTGLSATTGATVIAMPLTATTYTVTGTSTAGCSGTSTATVSINPAPSPIITPSGPLNFCAGSSVMLNTPFVATYSYQWYNNVVSVPGATNASYTAAISGNYTVLVANSFGCSATSTIATVSVDPAPSAINGPATVCQGANITLTDDVTGGAWGSNNTAVASVGLINGTVSAVSGGTAIITYTSGICTPVTTEVTVYPVGPILGAPVLCSGLTTSLSDAIVGGTWTSSNTGVALIGSSTGFISGLTNGISTIVYQFSTGCTSSTVLSVNLSPVAISGTTTLCHGTASTFIDGTSGGTWSSSNISVATIGSITGIADAVSATGGTTVISYTIPSTGCNAVATLTVNPGPGAISGALTVCSGLTTSLSDAPIGGTWSCNDPLGGPVDPVSGIVSGYLSGTDVITYTLPAGCYATAVVTINSSPLAITGNFGLCSGSSTILSDAVPGGTWSSSSATVASIGSVSGTVSSLSVGSTVVSYILSSGCNAAVVISVNPVPLPISGTLKSCTGYFVPLTDASGDGAWSSSNTSVATVGSSSGLVDAVVSGFATIRYSFNSTGCSVSAVYTVNPSPDSITGVPGICAGLASAFADLTAGGIWSSSNTGVATVGSSSGSVEGVNPGTATIVYTLPTTCSTTYPVTIATPPTPMEGPSTVCHSYTIVLSDGTLPGTWSVTPISGTAAITSSGVLTGLDAGFVIVSYTTPGCPPVSRTVIVNPLPAAVSGLGNLCQGSGTSLSDVTPGGTWSSNNTIVSVSSGGIVTGIDTGSNTNITYTLPTGCYVDAPVVVFPTPAPIMGVDSVCPGLSVMLSDSTVGGVWSSSNGSIALSIATTGRVEGETAGIVNISYTTIAGCYVTMPFKVEAPLPAALTIIQTPDTLLCAQTPVKLIANTVNGGASPHLTWELFGSLYMGDADTLLYSPDHGDYITCIMTTDGICAVPSVIEASLVFNIYPQVAPIVVVTTSSTDTAAYLGQDYTFFTDVTYGGTAPGYQWYVNSAAIAGATESTFNTHVYENNDSVYCFVTATTPCDTVVYGISNTKIIYGINYLSVSSISGSQNNFNVFPDPNTGKFIIEVGGADNQGKVDVFDVVGNKVYGAIINTAQTIVDISAQPNGIYFVRFTNTLNGCSQTKKIIKQ